MGHDLVVVTIPQGKIPNLPPENISKGAPDNLIVIDTGNYYPRRRDGRIEGHREWPARKPLGGTAARPSVIKVFDNIYAEQLGEKGEAARRPRAAWRVPIAGDSAKAKAVVIELGQQYGL